VTWSRFDDLYDEHENVEDAWFSAPPNPVGLHVMATTACNRWLTDGVIRPRWLERMLPKQREREQILDLMVQHNLFDFLPAGQTAELVDSDEAVVVLGPFTEARYVVHDFLDHHDSRRQIKERRTKDAERKRRGRRLDSSETPDGVRADSEGSPKHRASAGARASARVPTRPDPTSTPPRPPASGGRKRDQGRFAEQMTAWAQSAVPDLPARGVAWAVSQLRSANVAERDITVDRIRSTVDRAQPALREAWT
jgi:hypothetical protein